MIYNKIQEDYFDWLVHLVCREKQIRKYFRLLMYLHNTEFTWAHPRDENRAKDGIEMRWKYSYFMDDKNLKEDLDGPCTVLEMLIALSIRQEILMSISAFEDNTGKWFWNMVSNLKLDSMDEENFDELFIDEQLVIFLNRQYDADGYGNIFQTDDPHIDMRDIEIWYQMCRYISDIS